MELTVTKEFLTDLRKTEKIIIRNDLNNENKGHIRFEWKKYRKHEVEKVYTFETASRYSKTPKFCFVTLYKDISGWDALSKLLHVGDKIRFTVSDNRNGYLETCDAKLVVDGVVRETYSDGLHHDMLRADIYRKGGIFVNYLVLEDSIAPDNSARAIRGFYNPE